ncbi:MAG: putative protein-methionine-sulfoxide reductase subunit YedZ1 [Fimbriimonadaceae bacterium]|nr:putative protein-methionine-sulfoxide reductase subunit YedZ1 [Fimbriimonadaceae bacterium]
MDDSDVRRLSRRSFIWAGIAAGATYAGWRWLLSRPDAAGLPSPLRAGLEFNEDVWIRLSDIERLAPTFPSSMAKMPRVNGRIGLRSAIPDPWTLTVSGLAGPESVRVISLDAIRALPKVEVVTELKCVEGWSEVVRWGGVRFRDFMSAFPPANPRGGAGKVDEPRSLPRYVHALTPDGDYEVSLDMPSCLHSQTLLCYEMDGRPLEPLHGAPLRLALSNKYGYKSLKRLGEIRYTDQRQPDYWGLRGYDWYAGH